MIQPVSAWQCTDGRCFRDKEDATKHEIGIQNVALVACMRDLMTQHFEQNNRNPDWREYALDDALKFILDNRSLVIGLLNRYQPED